MFSSHSYRATINNKFDNGYRDYKGFAAAAIYCQNLRHERSKEKSFIFM